MSRDLKPRFSLVEMQIIAVEVTNSNHGDFLKHVARAWIQADLGNRAILDTAWKGLIYKYDLVREYAKEIEEHRGEYEEMKQ